MGRLETKEKSMSSKSSERSAMRALLIGAAVTGLIAGTTNAQASSAGNSVGDVANASGEKSSVRDPLEHLHCSGSHDFIAGDEKSRAPSPGEHAHCAADTPNGCRSLI